MPSDVEGHLPRQRAASFMIAQRRSPRRAWLAPSRPRAPFSSLFAAIGGGRRLTSVDWMIEVVVIA
jgi:hypothetical protein